MTEIRFELIGVDVVHGALTSAAKTADAQMGKKVKHFGALLKTRVMAAASGRPGPRAITGDYRRSWQHEYHSGGHSATSLVGTNAVQGHRLEYGFHGADSLGRIYNQPPFPHARPAFDKTAPEFEKAVTDMMGKIFA